MEDSYGSSISSNYIDHVNTLGYFAGNAFFGALILFCLCREYMMPERNDAPEILMDDKIFLILQISA